jgi:hypothetical protein
MPKLPPDEDAFVYVPVPSARVAEVYELLAVQPDEAAPRIDSERARLLERIYRESDTGFRALLRYLSERPERPIGTRAIAKGLELERGTASLAGMLGAFGRRSANRYDGYSPIETNHNPVKDSTELSMPQMEAEIIRKIVSRKRRPVKPARKRG